MKRITTLAATGLVSLALAACGSSNKSGSAGRSAGAATSSASTAVSSTPTSTGASSTPTATSTSTSTTSTSATGTATSAGGPMSPASFKAAANAQEAAAKHLGAALEKALQNAGHMTNATFASTFAALGQQFTRYAATFAQIHPPAKYAAAFDAIAKGYAKLAQDVTALSQATTAAQSRADSQTLIKDAEALQRPENTLGKELKSQKG